MELEHIAVRSGRLSSFLKGELNMSTGLMNRLKWTGALLVNGQPARTNTQVTPGTGSLHCWTTRNPNTRRRTCPWRSGTKTGIFWWWTSRQGC